MSANRARASVPQETSRWDLVIERTFDAPREFVFKAWTEPEERGSPGIGQRSVNEGGLSRRKDAIRITRATVGESGKWARHCR